MKTILIAFISIVFTASTLAQQSVVTLSHVGHDGKDTIHSISVTEAQKLPAWDPEGGQPAPLALNTAIKLGREWLKKKNPQVHDFAVTTISVERVEDDSIRNRWFYNVEFVSIIGGHENFLGRFWAVVLMNGTVVEPIVHEREKP